LPAETGIEKGILDNLEKLFQIIKEKGLRPVGVGIFLISTSMKIRVHPKLGASII